MVHALLAQAVAGKEVHLIRDACEWSLQSSSHAM